MLKYIICTSSCPMNLTKQVEEKLAEGFELYGYPFSAPAKNEAAKNWHNNVPQYCQAMIKQQEE